MDLIFFGMQGSGKGTLSGLVAERYGLTIFETGAQLRKLADQDSELAKKVKSIIEAGKLVSNDIVMEIVENFMNNLPANTDILFDGIPRKIEQANSLNKLLAAHGHKYLGVLIELKEATALRRLTTRRICENCKTVYPANYNKENCEKCGGKLVARTDDNPQSIKTRLEAFKQETLPAMELYKDNLIKIDGEPSIEEVKNIAFRALDPIMKV